MIKDRTQRNSIYVVDKGKNRCMLMMVRKIEDDDGTFSPEDWDKTLNGTLPKSMELGVKKKLLLNNIRAGSKNSSNPI